MTGAAPDGLSADGSSSTLLTVRAQPKASKNAVEGWVVDADGRPALKVRVTAAPSDGAANAAIVKTVAKALGTPKSAIEIISGETARLKRLRIAAPIEEARAALDTHLKGGG